MIRKRTVFLVGLLLVTTAWAAWIDKMERKMYGIKPGVRLEEYALGGYMPKEVHPILDEMVVKYRVSPRNPVLDRETGRIIQEVYGCEVDVKRTMKRLYQAPPNAEVALVRIRTSPKYQTRDLEDIIKEIGSFHTWFYGSWQRHQNIVLALMSINNQIIWPGEEFSFNKVVGPRTPERGYRIAPVIDGLGIGGGICQVSTTLYNAGLRAGLRVAERHPHSSRVPYVASGKDATVVYGSLDMRLINPYDHPVIIKAGIHRGKIIVRIMGK